MSSFWSLHCCSPLRHLTDYHSIHSETISPLNFHGSKPYWFFHVYSFSFFIFLEEKSLPSIFFCALVLLFKKSNMLFCFVFNCSVSIHFPRYRWVRKEKKKKWSLAQKKKNGQEVRRKYYKHFVPQMVYVHRHVSDWKAVSSHMYRTNCNLLCPVRTRQLIQVPWFEARDGGGSFLQVLLPEKVKPWVMSQIHFTCLHASRLFLRRLCPLRAMQPKQDRKSVV